MSGRAAAALAGLGALLALGWWLGGSPRGGGPPRAPAVAAVVAAGAGADVAPAPAAGGADPGPLPESLRGTDPDGGLALDAAGHFAPDREALALFDYFYSASGEESDAAIRARILAEIRRRLPPAAAAEAEAFFERYLAYREGAAALFQSDASFLDEERRLQRIRELRREAFGAGLADVLFGEEERIVALDLERRRLARDASLPPEERTRRLEALDASLPEAERQARAEARAALELREAEAALRAAGGDAAAIRAERERRLGPEAAARLEALDARRAAWDERVAAYRAERDALRARGLAPKRYTEELMALRDAHFRGAERLRIEALDRLEAERARAAAAQPAGAR